MHSQVAQKQTKKPPQKTRRHTNEVIITPYSRPLGENVLFSFKSLASVVTKAIEWSLSFKGLENQWHPFPASFDCVDTTLQWDASSAVTVLLKCGLQLWCSGWRRPVFKSSEKECVIFSITSVRLYRVISRWLLFTLVAGWLKCDWHLDWK